MKNILKNNGYRVKVKTDIKRTIPASLTCPIHYLWKWHFHNTCLHFYSIPKLCSLLLDDSSLGKSEFSHLSSPTLMTAGLHLHTTENELAMMPWFPLSFYLGHSNRENMRDRKLVEASWLYHHGGTENIYCDIVKMFQISAGKSC